MNEGNWRQYVKTRLDELEAQVQAVAATPDPKPPAVDPAWPNVGEWVVYGGRRWRVGAIYRGSWPIGLERDTASGLRHDRVAPEYCQIIPPPPETWPDGWEPTGDVRVPKPGEAWMTISGAVVEPGSEGHHLAHDNRRPGQRRHIVRRIEPKFGELRFGDRVCVVATGYDGVPWIHPDSDTTEYPPATDTQIMASPDFGPGKAGLFTADEIRARCMEKYGQEGE